MYIDYEKSDKTLDRFTLDAAQADTLKTTRTINGMQFNGSKNINNYGVCETAAGTATKVVTVGSDFTLAAGAQVVVKFTNANSASNPTLNVNSTGAKPVCQYGNTRIGTSTSSSSWRAGSIQTFTYDGTAWIRDYWTNSTYFTDAVQCTTAADTAAKVGSTSYYSLANNRYFMLMLNSANTYQGKITLNINGAGAKPIYINGAVSSASNYTLPAGLYLVHYDGTNYYFRTDGKITGSITGSSSTTIIATATDDDVVVLTGTNGTNKVTFDAKHAEKGPADGYISGNTLTAISGPGASGTIKVPQITVDKYGHVTAAADESVTITMPILPTSLKNPNSLTVEGNGTSLFTYDGSSAKTLNIKAGTNISVTSDTSGNITISSTDTNTTYSAATQSVAGLMSAADKKKLDGVTDSADVVSFTQSLTTGTQVGTITINGTATKLYAPTNTDTHYTTGLKVTNSATATANAAASNGSVYLNALDNTTVRDSHLIKGTGATTVASDANGVITINSINTTYDSMSINEGTTGTATINRVLTAANLKGIINAHAPTKTGGGASGTWGISISGNAATASSVAWGNVTGKPSTFTPSSHTHDDRYYTESEINSKLSGKSDTGHTHNYLPLAGGTMTGAIITPGDDSVVIRPAKNNYDKIGSSSYKFWQIYATTFYGTLSGNASTATQLETARTIRTNLSSTTAPSFDGTANITPGVTGTLAVGNGGTGRTYLETPTVTWTGGTTAGPTLKIKDSLNKTSSAVAIPSASSSASGIITTGDQSLAGFKTFAGGIQVTGTFQTKGEFEIYGFAPHIDFHFNNSTTDYTSRIIETSAGVLSSTAKFYGAVWNDYAEFRTQKETIEPGYCVASTNNGQVYKTTEKFQACDGIVSDTFGFAIGETDECKTPLAVAGRVLAYFHGNREDYNAGDTVCAGPEGKIMKMTREEIKEYPDRIIGIVSEIPEYETWGSGNVPVNGRIWIKVR